MIVEQQYIDLFSQTEAMICKHSAEVLNAPRALVYAFRFVPNLIPFVSHQGTIPSPVSSPGKFLVPLKAMCSRK